MRMKHVTQKNQSLCNMIHSNIASLSPYTNIDKSSEKLEALFLKKSSF